MKLFTIPNLITLLNLLSGCLAIVFAFNGNLVWSAYLVGIAAVLDFLDGFVARALKQFSPIGKDLDSLADMVTFGVVPGVVMFLLMQFFVWNRITLLYPFPSQLSSDYEPSRLLKLLPYAGFLIPLFSALRLAKFNNDTRQTDSFIGVPTPANSILICSLPLILWYQFPVLRMEQFFSGDVSPIRQYCLYYSPFILAGLSILMSYLLIAEIPLFALKVKGFGWKGNEIRYIFLLISLVMLVLLKFVALPLIIVLYVLLSVINNLVKKKKAPQA